MSQQANASASDHGLRAILKGLFDRRRWASVPRQTLFLLTALPLAIAVPVSIICLVSVGVGTAILGVGLVLLAGAIGLSRWFGALELHRLAWAGMAPIDPPSWLKPSNLSRRQRLAATLLDQKQWSYVAYGALDLLVGTSTGSLALVWIASILTGATAGSGTGGRPLRLRNSQKSGGPSLHCQSRSGCKVL